jgi:hypothetical protein
MEVHMATEILTQTTISTHPVTIATYKDATCFAQEAAAVLRAAASAAPLEKLVGAACLMERVAEGMQRAISITAEQRRQWTSEITTIAHVAIRMNDPGVDDGEALDLPLLYAFETLFNLTIERLQAPEGVQHG